MTRHHMFTGIKLLPYLSITTGMAAHYFMFHCTIRAQIPGIWFTKFFKVSLNIFSTITEVILSYIQQCVHSYQNSGSSAWNLFHGTLLVPGIWGWLIDIWKICGFLNTLMYSTKNVLYELNFKIYLSNFLPIYFHRMIIQCSCCFHHT
jgi:hypothetical protein